MFSKLKNIITNKKNEKITKFLVPVSGEIISLDTVDDDVFSQRMMGDGFAIIPSDGNVFSPFDGIVTSIFPTKHAITIKNSYGIEVLIHFGLDTVNLKGEGFTAHVSNEDRVKAGDLILSVDIASIKDKVKSLVVPIIFLDLKERNFTYNKQNVNCKDTNAVFIK